MFDWLTPTVLVILFVGFIIYNLIDRYLGRIEKTLIRMSGELRNIEKCAEKAAEINIEKAIISIENNLMAMETSLSSIRSNVDFFRGIVAQKVIEEIIRNNKPEAGQN